jgi:poly(A)-specific ribonuclease
LGNKPEGLNGMQKWLVHQLITQEFPDLRSRNISKFVQIDVADIECERVAQEQRLKTKKAQLQKHIGFRWIAEGLVGGNLDGLSAEMFNPVMQRIDNPSFGVDRLADRVKQRLRENRPVLVGHNMFCDLLFFHACFIGPLPDTIEDFQTAIHKLFPVLVDTKYLDTHDCGSINPMSSLTDLHAKLKDVNGPKIGTVN